MSSVLPRQASDEIMFTWPATLEASLEEGIVQLMRETTASDPIIGFGATITDTEASQYLAELRSNLAAEKCRLLTVIAGGEVIALCTLRRNLNPNNRHITDLAKGMISHRHRGTTLLAASLHEIANQCERDGVDLVTLDVRAGTRAHQVWERFGFEIYGTLPDYARVNGESRAGHFMMQKVSDLKARASAVLEARIPGMAQADGTAARSSIG
jgi:hypothetical protein